jgi:hypothetical protein
VLVPTYWPLPTQPSLSSRCAADASNCRRGSAAVPPSDLLAAGYRNSQIASELKLAEKTIRNHISSVLLKLQVGDRTAAALKARAAGLGTRHPNPGVCCVQRDGASIGSRGSASHMASASSVNAVARRSGGGASVASS